nr:LOW QUALITY PROTEIN: uncharacterized protein LOC108068187 [Drosophila takahashii]
MPKFCSALVTLWRHLACGSRDCQPRKDTDTDTDADAAVADADVDTDASAAPRPIDLAKPKRTEDNESCSPPKATNLGPHATIAVTATPAATPASTPAEAATGGKRKADRAEASRSGDLWPCLLYG